MGETQYLILPLPGGRPRWGLRRLAVHRDQVVALLVLARGKANIIGIFRGHVAQGFLLLRGPRRGRGQLCHVHEMVARQV